MLGACPAVGVRCNLRTLYWVAGEEDLACIVPEHARKLDHFIGKQPFGCRLLIMGTSFQPLDLKVNKVKVRTM